MTEQKKPNATKRGVFVGEAEVRRAVMVEQKKVEIKINGTKKVYKSLYIFENSLHYKGIRKLKITGRYEL